MGRRLAERPDEPIAVLVELTDLGLDPGRDVVDRDEEGQLALAEGVDDLAVAPAILKMLTPSVMSSHLGQVLVDARLLVQEVPRSSNALQRHPAVEERFDDPQRDEIAERVQPRNPGRPPVPWTTGRTKPIWSQYLS